MTRTLSVVSTALMVFVCKGALAAEWHVAPAPLGSNKNSGTEEEPFATIQRGIDAAKDGDTVIVAMGTYVENIIFKGENIILRSTDPSDWTVVKATIIDGNKAGSVVTFWGTEDESCVLSGFTIRNGTGTYVPDPTFPAFYGGGMIGAVPAAGASRTHATIQNNIITGNSANGGGGVNDCDGPIRNNIIIGNRAEVGGAWNGGGIGFCDGIIEDNLIAGNSASCGGGISFSNADFRNNIVVANTALLGGQQHGGGLAHLGTSPYGPAGGSITNCIIWGNTAATGPQVHDSLTPTYSCIQDWTGGVGNIALDPQFVDPDGADDDAETFADNNYHLCAASPCIDEGKNEEWMSGAVDLDGNPRILAGASSLTVDMGAYEYKFSIGGIRIVPATGALELTWNSRTKVRYSVRSCTELAGGLWSEGETIASQGEQTTWTDRDPASMVRFYRVEIE